MYRGGLVNFESSVTLRENLAARFKTLRLSQNVSQSELSERSGVSLGSIRRFEQEGEISLKHLVNLCIALQCADQLQMLFKVDNRNLFAKPLKARQRAR